MTFTITTKLDFDFNKIDVGELNKIGLTNSSQKLQLIAADNAPYDTGKLSQSVSTEPRSGSITKNTKSVKIWPQKVVYAQRREYENKKNPAKKFYMKRTADVAPRIVKQEFDKALQIIIKSL